MGFNLPQLNTCCCGCTLKTGSLIILWLYVLYGLLLLCAIPLSHTGHHNATKIEVKTTTESITQNQIDWQAEIAPLGYWSVVCGVVVVAVGGLALYGIYRELHAYIYPFLVWVIVNALIQGIATIVKSFDTGTILGEIIHVLIIFYFWLVVYSHFRVLKGTVRPIQA